jgi:hypothetical protein
VCYRTEEENTAPPDQDNQGSKVRKVPALVMWYLPIIDRLKLIFSNAREAQILLWHVQRKRDGKIRHPGDGRQWKHLTLAMRRTFLMIQGILDLVLAPME